MKHFISVFRANNNEMDKSVHLALYSADWVPYIEFELIRQKNCIFVAKKEVNCDAMLAHINKSLINSDRSAPINKQTQQK